jgi:hypothetical protein
VFVVTWSDHREPPCKHLDNLHILTIIWTRSSFRNRQMRLRDDVDYAECGVLWRFSGETAWNEAGIAPCVLARGELEIQKLKPITIVIIFGYTLLFGTNTRLYYPNKNDAF